MAEPARTEIEIGCWVAAAPDRADRRLVAVEISPPSAVADTVRPPIDLVLAIDRSSSMVGTRIAAAVEAARQICLRLGQRDRLAVVAFDGLAQVVRWPGAVTPETAAEIVLELTELGVGYGTNISAAWKKAVETIARGGIPGASKTVLLMTDGLPSRGLREHEELAALARSGVAQGIVTSAVGIGDRFDEKLLARMAVAGGGSFRFAEHDEDTIAVADEEVEGLTGLVAEDAVLHLGFARVVSQFEVLHELKCRPDGDGVAVDVGRVFAGRPRQVLIQVTVTGDARHLGAIGLSCMGSDGESREVDPVRILVPAPGQESGDLERVGAAFVPLTVARWQQKIWDCGRDPSFRRVAEVIALARKDLAGLAEDLRTSPEAAEAIARFEAGCNRIEEILRDVKASPEAKRRNTDVALKGMSEESSHTMVGVTSLGPHPPGGRRGWGKK
jgi:Ca-activated chloride channel family protein